MLCEHIVHKMHNVTWGYICKITDYVDWITDHPLSSNIVTEYKLFTSLQCAICAAIVFQIGKAENFLARRRYSCQCSSGLVFGSLDRNFMNKLLWNLTPDFFPRPFVARAFQSFFMWCQSHRIRHFSHHRNEGWADSLRWTAPCRFWVSCCSSHKLCQRGQSLPVALFSDC